LKGRSGSRERERERESRYLHRDERAHLSGKEFYIIIWSNSEWIYPSWGFFFYTLCIHNNYLMFVRWTKVRKSERARTNPHYERMRRYSTFETSQINLHTSLSPRLAINHTHEKIRWMCKRNCCNFSSFLYHF